MGNIIEIELAKPEKQVKLDLTFLDSQKKPSIDIFYASHPSPFGSALIFADKEQLYGLGFTSRFSEKDCLAHMRKSWKKARFIEDARITAPFADSIFGNKNQKAPLPVTMAGTAFQMEIWRALLSVRPGQTKSYGELAEMTGRKRSTHGRAIGNAMSGNSLAWLIPCHRIINHDGKIGNYRWGFETKKAMLAAESTMKSAMKSAAGKEAF